MDKDIRGKKANFIDESTEIRETFSFAGPMEILGAVKLYVGSHYGSMLWDLGGSLVNQYFNAWYVCVKLALQVPRAAHTYFVDHLLSCGHNSVREDLLARYTKFVRSLRSSPSAEVSVMLGVVSKDVRTNTGSNLTLLKQETGCIELSSKKVKEVMFERRASVPEADRWRLVYLARLLEKRGEQHYQGADTGDLTNLIESLCVN